MKSKSIVINSLLDKKKLTIAELERKLLLKKNTISSIIQRNSRLSQDFLSKCLTSFPDLNPVWLITETGDMFSPNYTLTDSQISIASEIPTSIHHTRPEK